jgi:pentatricopeptide repeat protein
VHAYCIRLGLLADDGNVTVASSLVYVYAKCGIVDAAVKVFEEMPERDMVAWTSLPLRNLFQLVRLTEKISTH